MTLEAFGVPVQRATSAAAAIDDCQRAQRRGHEQPIDHYAPRASEPRRRAGHRRLREHVSLPADLGGASWRFDGSFCRPALRPVRRGRHRRRRRTCPARRRRQRQLHLSRPPPSGSIVSPANSPYALAVGAADAGAHDGAPTAGTLEYFSSQGPTIDGRVKPDITGWDGVSSPCTASPTPSQRDSASTARPRPRRHVAGAAALVKAANPALDAAQIQNFLEQRASQRQRRSTRRTTRSGHGLLTLGAPPADTVVAGSASGAALHRAATPRAHPRHPAPRPAGTTPLGAGGTASAAVPGLPADATAVAINLTGHRAPPAPRTCRRIPAARPSPARRT